MIEIIKPRTKEKISCKSCGCLFSYEKEDIEIGHPHNLYPLVTEIKYITCPQCNEKIELEATK
jgi:DNA-directed RNA polymerase subunit RPC12/RpoP